MVLKQPEEKGFGKRSEVNLKSQSPDIPRKSEDCVSTFFMPTTPLMDVVSPNNIFLCIIEVQ